MSESNPSSAPANRSTKFSFNRFRRTVLLGLKSLWLHKLRSLLTALGIVFGVSSVIAMLAIGEGASYEAQEQIKKLGSQNIILKSLKPTANDKGSETSSSRVLEYGLTYDDVRRIQATIPGVTVVVPARVIREFTKKRNRRIESEIKGTVAWYPEMRNHKVSKGRFFTDLEVTAKSPVCVISQSVADEVFRMEEPVGSTLKVGQEYYRVIGITENRGSASSENAAASETETAVYEVFIPLTTIRSRFGETIMKRRAGSFEAERVELHEATVQVDELEQVINVSLVVKDLLNRYHDKEDFKVEVPLEQLQQAEKTKQIFNIVLGSIAAISLLVGGIGIMNIMLASVTERTREIGIRRALGAKKKDIIIQFLIETIMLSVSGGLLGVALGISVPYLVTIFADMKTIVTFWSPAIAFSISALVGVVFGIYPALRAAEMDPVEALRHE